MRRLLLLSLAVLFLTAISPIKKTIIFGSGPKTAAFNFLTNPTLDPRMTFTRSSNRTCTNSSGLIVGLVANQPCFDYSFTSVGTPLGLLLETSRANIVLNNRDMSQASWVKTTMTAARDQIGVGGAANAASSILATGANATILNSVTATVNTRSQTAYVKRITGSGVVNMTMDNGVTWTVVAVTASWARVSIPSQSVTNPVMGFRLVTNGDKIAVDYVQNEIGTFATSAIATAASAVSRTAEALTMPGASIGLSQTAGSMIAYYIPQDTAATTYGIGEVNDNSANNRVSFSVVSTPKQAITMTSGGVTSLTAFNNGTNAPAANTLTKGAIAWANADVGNTVNNGTVTTSALGTPLPVNVNTLWIGSRPAGISPFDGWIQYFEYQPTRLPNATLQTKTSANDNDPARLVA